VLQMYQIKIYNSIQPLKLFISQKMAMLSNCAFKNNQKPIQEVCLPAQFVFTAIIRDLESKFALRKEEDSHLCNVFTFMLLTRAFCSTVPVGPAPNASIES
jgi:hypothetical protein